MSHLGLEMIPVFLFDEQVVFTNQLKRDLSNRLDALHADGKLDLNSAVVAMLVPVL